MYVIVNKVTEFVSLNLICTSKRIELKESEWSTTSHTVCWKKIVMFCVTITVILLDKLIIVNYLTNWKFKNYLFFGYLE